MTAWSNHHDLCISCEPAKPTSQSPHAFTCSTPLSSAPHYHPHQSNYGQKDPAAVARVKAVYEELGMKGRFEAYEAESYERLSALISEQKLLPEGVFTNLLQKIYKRSK